MLILLSNEMPKSAQSSNICEFPMGSITQQQWNFRVLLMKIDQRDVFFVVNLIFMIYDWRSYDVLKSQVTQRLLHSTQDQV